MTPGGQAWRLPVPALLGAPHEPGAPRHLPRSFWSCYAVMTKEPGGATRWTFRSLSRQVQSARSGIAARSARRPGHVRGVPANRRCAHVSTDVFCLAAHRNAHAARSGGSCVLSGSLRAAASCAVDRRRKDSCPLCLWRSSHCCHSSRGRWAVDAGPPRYPRRRVDGLTSTQQRPGARSSTASNDRARTPSTMPATSAWFIRHNTSGRAWAAWRKGQLRSTM